MGETHEIPHHNLADFEPWLGSATEGQAVSGIPLQNPLEGPQYHPQQHLLHSTTSKDPHAMAEMGKLDHLEERLRAIEEGEDYAFANLEELFLIPKHGHSQVQGAIECAFGLCKARWKILGNMPPFTLKTQNQIIVACMAIHNFIQRNDKSDGEFDSLDEDNENIDSDEDESEVDPSITTWEEPDAQSTLQMERFRESLKNMFPTRI